MRTLLALIASALLWGFAASPVDADRGGVVEGRVINGSQDGGSVGDLEATLIMSSEPVGKLATRTSPRGQFRFEGLSTSPGDTYTVVVRYQGVDYTAGGIQLNPEIPVAQVEVQVYETITSAEALRVLLDHHIVKADPQERRLEVVNYVKVANTGDRTVVTTQAGPGLQQPTLFPLPEGAEKVQLLGGSPPNRPIGQGELTLNKAVPPGEHELLFAYELAYAGDSLVFRKPVAYPTNKAVFLMSAHDAGAESEQLPAIKEVESAAGPYQLLSGEGLPASTVLEVTLTRLPASGGTSLGDVLAPAAVIAAILALGAMVGYAHLRRRGARPQEEQP